MTNNLDNLNLNYFNQVKSSLIDPSAKEISKDINWFELDQNWSNAKFPVVISGEGDPVIFLHGFDSCYLEFRRIFPLLKTNFKLIIPDLFGFAFLQE